MKFGDQTPVTRVEFQLRKDVLKELQSKDFNSFVKNIQGVWQYLTSKWFRQGEDFNRDRTDRAKNTPWWDIVNSLSWSDTVVFLERTALKAKKVIEPLVDQAAGLAISMCAYLGQSAEEVKQVIETFSDAVGRKLKEAYETNRTEYLRKFNVRQAECWDSLYYAA